MKWLTQILIISALCCVLLPGGRAATERSGNLQATRIIPQSGSTSGGTVVTIVGEGFSPGATVSFGYVPATVGYERATQVKIESPTVIKAITPPHNSGTVDLVISNPDGSSSTLTNAFTYTGP